MASQFAEQPIDNNIVVCEIAEEKPVKPAKPSSTESAKTIKGLASQAVERIRNQMARKGWLTSIP